MAASDLSKKSPADQTSGEMIPVPVGLLAKLADEYLRGHCPIKGGWGDSATIEALIALAPPAQIVRAALPEETWDVVVWVGSNYVHGTVDGAHRTRIVDAVASVLGGTDAE